MGGGENHDRIVIPSETAPARILSYRHGIPILQYSTFDPPDCGVGGNLNENVAIYNGNYLDFGGLCTWEVFVGRGQS